MAKRRKRPLKAKYIARRFLLLLIVLGAFAAAGWFVYIKFFSAKLPEPILLPFMATSGQTADTAIISDSDPEVEPEPEPEPELEPETPPDGWELILVNAANPLPEGYTPELAVITGTHSVDKRIAENVNKMFTQAKLNGIELVLSSAYSENGTGLGAEEYRTGLAIDIADASYKILDEGFAATHAFKWLHENADQFGFVLRYPADKTDITGVDYKPWHYRYVGAENALVMKARGICLEEYVKLLDDAKNSVLSVATPSATEEGTLLQEEAGPSAE